MPNQGFRYFMNHEKFKNELLLKASTVTLKQLLTYISEIQLLEVKIIFQGKSCEFDKNIALLKQLCATISQIAQIM